MGRRRGTSAFPVARIKKMMQADDEVGKIATVTPMLVAKALECMMELVISEASHVAIERRSRTVQPLHLKSSVMRNDSCDFLRHVFDGIEGSLDTMPSPPDARAPPDAPMAAASPRPPARDRPSSARRAAIGKRPRSLSRPGHTDASSRPTRLPRGNGHALPPLSASMSSLPALSSPALLAAVHKLPPLTAPNGSVCAPALPLATATATPAATPAGASVASPSPSPADNIATGRAEGASGSLSTRPSFVRDEEEEDYDEEEDDGLAHGQQLNVCDGALGKTTASTDVDGDDRADQLSPPTDGKQEPQTQHDAPKASRVSVHALLS